MILDRVTITGADDSIDPMQLIPLTEKYPFVEWGILFSGSRQGTPRYPSNEWLSWLTKNHLPNLSAHLCGRWVRDFVLNADSSWWKQYPDAASIFKRVQINFHGQYHRASANFIEELRKIKGQDIIFQHDGVNDGLILAYAGDSTIRAFPLFDLSGGAGVVPREWPKPIWAYQGYAGGLGPDNIVDEIHRISKVAGASRIWIDMETKVRSEDDGKFVIRKVERCLELAAPFVSQETDAVKGGAR